MGMKIIATVAALALLGGAGAPTAAEVVQATPASFEIKQVVTVEASVARTWGALMVPQKWWDHEHTYSDESANLYLDPQATGCFCERIPASKGTVEHARVVYIQPPRMLRLVGALGPLQAEAVTGTLTFRLDPETKTTTRVTLDYVVGGYVRAGADTLAPKVDEVLATQLIGLKAAAEAGVDVAPKDNAGSR
jgi:uncharacterized protein YndB with AHSA1/START domain